MIRFKFSTPDAQTLPTPSIFLFDVHRRFAAALHLFSIEDTVARGWPPQPRVLRQLFFSAWLYIPPWLRLRCYLLLGRFGAWFYGGGIEHTVQRLPFGLVLKRCIRYPSSAQNEPNALRLVERYAPDIPAPRVVDVGESNGETCLLMTHLPGQMLNDVLHLMSYAERDRFADDLANASTAAALFLFCNTLGGPVIDHRIPDGSGGPFRSEAEFNAHLTSHLECLPGDIVGEENVRYDHRSCFTHSDFHCTNLLVDRGRLRGIIDWECAGFLPEYWEFTKAMYSARQHPAELEVERKLWRYTPFGV
ncbi:hypothetical protein DV735_g1999, partial [Chaetothyriales sp. CBS 134920]